MTVEDGDTSNDDNLISRANTDYLTTWEAITKEVVEALGAISSSDMKLTETTLIILMTSLI